jgi:steroid 5-alpha reductase family enzyme
VSTSDSQRRQRLQALVALPVILVVGAAIGWAGSQGGERVGGMPVFALCALLCFVLNWAVFVPSYLAQTERYYDLTGSITYLSVIALGVGLSDHDPRALLLALLVAAWSIRLGSFLFARIRRDGSDGRFDALKPDFTRFLMAWTLQGLWVLLTVSCALAAITAADAEPLGVWALLGTLVWIAGFAIEGVADRQKQAFRSDPANRDRFITTGLWAWSRHPNYCGEIVLWIGVALIALPALSGWSFATLVSPVFVYVLLTRISGVPLLEARAKKKWGDDPAYRAYKARTPVLWPRPPWGQSASSA